MSFVYNNRMQNCTINLMFEPYEVENKQDYIQLIYYLIIAKLTCDKLLSNHKMSEINSYHSQTNFSRF